MKDDMPGLGMAAAAVSYGLLRLLLTKGLISHEEAEKVLDVSLQSLEKHPPDNPVVNNARLAIEQMMNELGSGRP